MFESTEFLVCTNEFLTKEFQFPQISDGEGIKKAIDEGIVKREDLFVVSKLWNTEVFSAAEPCEYRAKTPGGKCK